MDSNHSRNPGISFNEFIRDDGNTVQPHCFSLSLSLFFSHKRNKEGTPPFWDSMDGTGEHYAK